ncbi:NAD(P)/FAD-dependent oxidoreductase [Oceaniglobus trochenteri]|uniref:NAD(P)/FAD-dependent oxidoreductase n=1 Tax=Oceaniglobus trochenteri TaxID=2763260 RepID=UPI001CFF9DC3|nr:FAD-binding oxidoreductase [Oceaniglobus trochenteri]
MAQHQSYDVVIVGGAIMGSSAAWFLTQEPDFDGRVLVVERDPTYENCSTSHTNSCIRQQFSTEINVRISQFGADYVQNLRSHMGGDPDVPNLKIQNFGYLYLADDPAFAKALRASHKVQVAAGAGTRLLNRDQLAAAFPFYQLDDILLASHNTVDEGYFDGSTMFDHWRKGAKAKGVEFIADEVVKMDLSQGGTRVTRVHLKSGATVCCGQVVNATGPRAARTARMAGISVPIEPRKRFTWVFEAARPLDRPLPLTIDPSGVHVRQEGTQYYMAGGHADHDPAVEPDDFAMDHAIWEDKIWPALANRIPQFEAIKVRHEWVGHYAWNVFDQNAILGPHPEVSNFLFLNGFSGHGLQQSPAMGRGTAEMLVHGAYRTLDLSPFHYGRIVRGAPFVEKAVI